MSVTEAKSKFEDARRVVASCRASIAELQRKSDSLQESLPGLSREVENSAKVKISALDAFAMTSNKITESALRVARGAHEAAQKVFAEGNELAEATNRALVKQQAGLTRLNNAFDLARREYWESIADEIKNNIPAHIFDAVRTLFVAGVQCCMTRQFILDSLFPNIPSGEFQTIRSELVKEYGIDE